MNVVLDGWVRSVMSRVLRVRTEQDVRTHAGVPMERLVILWMDSVIVQPVGLEHPAKKDVRLDSSVTIVNNGAFVKTVLRAM